jgi:cytochrome c
MSGMEWNKVAAAILLAGLIAMLSGFFAREFVRSEPPAEPAYAVAPAEPSGPAEPAVATGPADIVPLLASADPAAGQAAARVCQACHTFDKGGPAKVGPNLWGIVNAPHGHAQGFNYSKAITGKPGPWGYEELNRFLFNPKAYAPGTKMSFAGLRKDGDRANVIAYLRSLADQPAPLP